MKRKDRKLWNGRKKLDLTVTSGAACYILLILYENRLKDVESLENLKLGFESNILTGKQYCDDYYNKWPLAQLLSSQFKDVDCLINAFRYLKDKNLLIFEEIDKSYGDYMFCNFHLTADGVDIIEGTKNNLFIRRKFAKIFNLSIFVNIDSLIKVDNIVGVGGAVSTG